MGVESIFGGVIRIFDHRFKLSKEGNKDMKGMRGSEKIAGSMGFWFQWC